MNTTNAIPGTENNPLCPDGPYYATPGVKSAFADYLDGIEQRKANRKAKKAVEAVQAEAKTKTPKVEGVKTPKVNDKKVAAQRLFEANKDKGSGAIAQMIATELEITYANAYYYVTRVFKR
jgi:hypothetical protein